MALSAKPSSACVAELYLRIVRMILRTAVVSMKSLFEESSCCVFQIGSTGFLPVHKAAMAV